MSGSSTGRHSMSPAFGLECSRTKPGSGLKQLASKSATTAVVRAGQLRSQKKQENTSIRDVIPRARRIIPMPRSEEHTSELQSLMRISYAVFCLKKKKKKHNIKYIIT